MTEAIPSDYWPTTSGTVSRVSSRCWSDQKLGKSLGDNIRVIIEQDLEIREVIIPDDVKILLDDNPRAKKYFESLSYTDRKEYIRWIESAKQAETRERRIGIFIGKLKVKKKFMES